MLGSPWKGEFGMTDVLSLADLAMYLPWWVVPDQGLAQKILICGLGFFSVEIRAGWLLHAKISLSNGDVVFKGTDLYLISWKCFWVH